MASKIDEMSEGERKNLIGKLLDQNHQDGKCFLCGEEIDANLSKIEIDHITPLSARGSDDESNWAVVHKHCNRIKQAKDLRLAKMILNYRKDKEKKEKLLLADILKKYGGSKHLLKIKYEPERAKAKIIYVDNGHEITKQLDVYYGTKDKNFASFYTILPIECIFHDGELNPRGVGDNVIKLIGEFWKRNPQLHVCLCRLHFNEEDEGKVLLFDGQHKAAAQIYNGIKYLPVRVFINPDKDKLKEVNRRAHKELRQIEFFRSILDELGSDIFGKEFRAFLEHPETIIKSEKAFIDSLSPERRREMKNYLRNYLKDKIIHPPNGFEENEFFKFVEMQSGRSKKWPISYDSVEKSFFKFFVDMMPCDVTYDKETHPRYLERKNLTKLMNILAKKVLIGKFDENIGSYKIEERLRKGEMIQLDHLRAYRLFRPKIFQVWCEFLGEAMGQMLLMRGKITKDQRDNKRIFWVDLDDEEWKFIEKMIDALINHKIWVDTVSKIIPDAVTETRLEKVKIFLERGEIESIGKVVDDPINIGFFIKAIEE